MGPGNSRDIDFSFCKVLVYAQHCGDILMVESLLFFKIPAQIAAGKCKICKITITGLGMESKALRFHDTMGTMLRLKHGT